MSYLNFALKSLLPLSILYLTLQSNISMAAKVPAGVKLAAPDKQVINFSLPDNPPTIDPQRVEDIIGNRVAMDLYEALMTEDENGKIVLGVAERYEMSADGKTYTFYLKKNAKFSDGSPITASDVVFSYRRLVDPKTASPYSFVALPIKNAAGVTEGIIPLTSLGIEAINPTTVKITLENPTPYFTALIAMNNFGIIKEENVAKYKDSFTQPGKLISSGAYKLTYWKMGDKLTLVKNPYYWNAKNTVVQTVNFFPVVDNNSEIQMYYAGQIDFTFFTIPPEKMKDIRATIPNELKVITQLATYYYDFNMRKEPFKNNLKLRQALSMAIDRNILTRDILAQGQSPIYDLVAKATVNYMQQNYEWATWSADKRLEEAQRLFKESGYSPETPLKVSISYNTDVGHKKIAIAVASMWQKAFGKLGLKISMENQEWKVFLRSRQTGDFMVARDGWVADYNDASTFTNLLASKNVQNNSGYQNDEYDEIQEEAGVEQNAAKREALFEKGMRLALADYPIVPLYNYVTLHLVKPFIGGFTQRNPLDHIYSRDLYVMEH